MTRPRLLDWDGDGDLDLVVGAYSLWKPEGRALPETEQARVAELERITAAPGDLVPAPRRTGYIRLFERR